MNDIIRGSAFAADPYLRNAVVIGQWSTGGLCLLDMELLKLPGHILGPIGTGKTVCTDSIIRQLMMRQTPLYREFAARRRIPWQPVSIVYVTFVQGRDDRQFNYLAEGARMAGMKIRTFNPRPGRRTHVYNPYLQSFLNHMGKADIAEHFGEAGDFLGNEIYGQKYFGTKGFRMLIKSIKACGRRFNSYWDHADYLEDTGNDEKMEFGGRDRGSGDLVIDHMGIMATVHPLNEHPRKNGPPDSVFESAIDFMKVFQEPHFVYVNLDWLGEKRAHTIGKHMLFDAARAAKVLERWERNHQVFFIVDEAQSLVKSEGVMGIFDRVRHKDLSIILAHQYAEQLIEGGADFSKGVDVNFPWTLNFSLPTPESIERMQKYAPDDLRHMLRFPVSLTSFDRDDLAEAVAIASGYRADATEHWTPRYTKEMVMALNATNRSGWLRTRFNTRATRVHGVAPFLWSHTMSLAQWDAYADLGVSLPVSETVEVLKDPDFEREETQEPPRQRRIPRSPEVLRAPGTGTAAGDAEIERHLASGGR